MGIIAWIIIEVLAGGIASMVVGHNAEQGRIGNVAVGVIGAFVGVFIFTLLGGDGFTGFNVYSLLAAVAGAVVVLLAKNALVK